MVKSFDRIMLLLIYCTPFVFLAMNEDATVGTLWFYLIMILGFGALCYGSIKSKNLWIVVVGNILNYISSSIFTWNFQTEKWGWYFKPFTPYQFVLFEMIFVFVVQIVIVIYSVRKQRRKR